MTAHLAPPKGHVLLLEDEADTARLLTDFLQLEGYTVTHAPDGHVALNELSLHGERFHLAILDHMVPGPDGRAVLNYIRSHQRLQRLPVIMLTARDEEADEIATLRLGADDYITKPASLHRIKARLDTLLRRSPTATQGTRHLGALALDRSSYSLTLAGHDIPLTLSEFKLLELLMEPVGTTRGRSELLAVLPSEGERYVFDRTVDAHIKNLRAKLPTYDELIMTVRGVGYRINPDFAR